jgi:hypothetical protein
MKMSTPIVSRQWWLVILILLAGGTALVPLRAHAQAGQNAVYNSGPINSLAFIDAANFSSNNGLDFCGQLNAVLTSTATNIEYSNWQVIDARGITSTTCLSNPWTFPSTQGPPWVTVLLPAGTIQISSTWTLPQHTRIIGQGPGITTLQATSSLSGPLIQMGCYVSGSKTCGLAFGVSVENLTLDGYSFAVDGIDNNDAQEQSYVKHVQMINIGGTGLSLKPDPNATPPNPQGPNHSNYSDISITETANGAACVNIAQGGYDPGVTQPLKPRGIHGLNCTCMTSGTVCSSNSHPGVYLDGSSVSLEDVSINGFGDGILIGSQESAYTSTVQSDIILNVHGGSSLTNVVHICGANPGNHTACYQSYNNVPVTDLTLMGITSTGTNTIQDDVTDTLLTESSDPTVGMYVLGEGVTAGSSTAGYSRFTTSPSVPAWLVGTSTLSSSITCAEGSLYSKTSGTGSVLWGCNTSGKWTTIR